MQSHVCISVKDQERKGLGDNKYKNRFRVAGFMRERDFSRGVRW
jgi:hypothetical protein